ncbi:hypothetical protein V8C44DRAFT_340768 [Trichoderma aethiopicum]
MAMANMLEHHLVSPLVFALPCFCWLLLLFLFFVFSPPAPSAETSRRRREEGGRSSIAETLRHVNPQGHLRATSTRNSPAVGLCHMGQLESKIRD